MSETHAGRGLRLLAPLLVAACVFLLSGAGCNHPPSGSGALPSPGAASVVRFTDVTEQAGIRFRHFNGARGKKYMPETAGSGLAFLDYDNDGWQDLLVLNGTSWPGDPNPHATPHLYRNARNGAFTDVTLQSGLDRELYGMGVAVGDYDNDGFVDLYLTALGPNRLLRNTLGSARDGKGPIFQDVTASAGVVGEPVPGQKEGLLWKWSTSAAWLDYDRDGRLDLFVCNYVKWSPATDLFCGKPGGAKGYCPPDRYTGVPCTLYHNEGNGKFRDVSTAMGIRTAQTGGKSFGVAVADFNGDNWPDIAVANDTWPNFLFLNDRGKRFQERGAESGIAWSPGAKTKAGMGIEAADWNNSGRFGLLIGNFSGESLTLFENDGHAFFTDRAATAGMGSSSLLFLTFGLFFADFDLDGWPDALAANGHIDDLLTAGKSMVSYRERPLLFLSERNGRFREVGAESGLTRELVGRGAAWADWDHDGDPDIAILSSGEGVLLYRNEGITSRHWLRVRARGHKSNRDGIGALVRVTRGGVIQSQYVKSGGSYLSESQRPLLFGLGAAAQADQVEVRWPSGTVTKTGPLAADRPYLVDEAAGVSEDRS